MKQRFEFLTSRLKCLASLHGSSSERLGRAKMLYKMIETSGVDGVTLNLLEDEIERLEHEDDARATTKMVRE